jgi:hypothetical protein
MRACTSIWNTKRFKNNVKFMKFTVSIKLNCFDGTFKISFHVSFERKKKLVTIDFEKNQTYLEKSSMILK